MATKGSGRYKGAIRKREQSMDCETGSWTKKDSSTGETVSTKKSKKPYKSVRKKKSGGGGGGGGGGGSRCFITTACVETLGLSDDCHEMTTLRWFRDNYLLTSKEGNDAVEQYYQIAPSIVSAIKASKNSEHEFKKIFDIWICSSVNLIESGKFLEAFDNYKNCISQLSKKYDVSDNS